jgi:hypothetical protein
MQTLIDPFLLPIVEPNSPYTPSNEVIAFCEAQGIYVVFEIYRPFNLAFSFRYYGWVAWRDAGGYVRSHSWHRFYPPHTSLVSTELEAKSSACKFAEDEGITLGNWKNNTDSS